MSSDRYDDDRPVVFGVAEVDTTAEADEAEREGRVHGVIVVEETGEHRRVPR